MEINPKDLKTLMSVGGSAVGAKSKHHGWKIDALELGKAKELFDLELTVMVRFGHGLDRRGTHSIRSRYVQGKGRAYWHHIVISNRISKVEQANRTLWHELTHASQVEQWVKATGRKPDEWYDHAYKDGVAYGNKFWEQHANQVADEMIAEGRFIIK